MKPLQSLVVLLLAVAIGVVAAQWLGTDDLNRYGEVTLRYAGYDYHSNLPKVALLSVIGVLVLWLLWSLIVAPFRAWGRYRRKQGRVRLIDGLLAYEHGQWQRAEKLLDGAAKDPEVSGVALANAVRSAQVRADAPAAEALLQRLGESDATLQALLRAEQLLANDLPVDAINVLDVAAIQPLPPRGLWLRTEALARAGRAHEAYGQLGALRQTKVLPAEASSELEARLAAQALLEAGDVNALAAQWEATPKALRPTPDVVAAYATRAVALDWTNRHCWRLSRRWTIAGMTNWWRCMAVCRPSVWLHARPTCSVGATCTTIRQPCAWPRAASRWRSSSGTPPTRSCMKPSPLVPAPLHGRRWAKPSHSVANTCWPRSA